MTFSLVHASRQRIRRAGEALGEWRSRASGDHTIQYILSVDDDDPDLELYRSLAASNGVALVTGPNRTMVEAVNRGAKAATGDVLIAVSDDFGCPERWDRSIAQVIAGAREAAVLVHDGLQARILTLPILTRAFYERLGYLYHPAYISMFADDDLTDVARAAGVLIDARHLTFPHRHHVAGLSEPDDTYRRQNSNRSWWHGWGVFRRRQIDGFGAPRTDLRSRLRKAGVAAYCGIRGAGSRGRGFWRARLPGWARAREDRARTLVLRLVARLTAVRPPD